MVYIRNSLNVCSVFATDDQQSGRRWNELVVAPIHPDYLRFISGRVRRVQHGIDNSFGVFNDVEWSVAERTSVPLSRLTFLGMSNQNVATDSHWWKKTMMKYLFTSCLHVFVSLLYLSSDRIWARSSSMLFNMVRVWVGDSTRRDSTKQAVKASSPNIFAIFTAIARGPMLEYRPMKHPFPGTCRFRKAGKCSRNCIPFIP